MKEELILTKSDELEGNNEYIELFSFYIKVIHYTGSIGIYMFND